MAALTSILDFQSKECYLPNLDLQVTGGCFLPSPIQMAFQFRKKFKKIQHGIYKDSITHLYMAWQADNSI